MVLEWARWNIGLFEDGRAHRLDVEADALAVAAVAVGLEGPDLVERAAEVRGAERLVLVVLQAVLVVEVDAPEFPVLQGVGHVVGRIQAGEDRMADSMRTPELEGSTFL